MLTLSAGAQILPVHTSDGIAYWKWEVSDVSAKPLWSHDICFVSQFKMTQF